MYSNFSNGQPPLPQIFFNNPLLEIVAHNFKTTSQKNKINTVLNLITFSIVFTYNNGMDRFDHPPPPIKTKVNTSKLKILGIKFDKCWSMCLFGDYTGYQYKLTKI